MDQNNGSKNTIKPSGQNARREKRKEGRHLSPQDPIAVWGKGEGEGEDGGSEGQWRGRVTRKKESHLSPSNTAG